MKLLAILMLLVIDYSGLMPSFRVAAVGPVGFGMQPLLRMCSVVTSVFHEKFFDLAWDVFPGFCHLKKKFQRDVLENGNTNDKSL